MLNQVVSAVLLELHRGCRKQTVESFTQWALALVQQAIPHDRWDWGITTEIDGEIVVHASQYKNNAPELVSKWEQYKHVDMVVTSYLREPNVVHNVTYEILKDAEIYPLFFRELGIAQILGLYAYQPSSGFYDVIALCRSDPEMPFSEEDRLVMECLVPHLIEARHINYLEHMSVGMPRVRQYPVAAVDGKGVIHVAEDGFVELIRTEWPQWQGPRLPELLARNIRAAGFHYDGSTIMVRIVPVSDMFLLSVRQRSLFDNLTRREREIARHFATGLSNKEIARMIGLSPTSVRNHLSSIYRKLGVGDKGELATLLSVSAAD